MVSDVLTEAFDVQHGGPTGSLFAVMVSRPHVLIGAHVQGFRLQTLSMPDVDLQSSTGQ